MNIKEMIKRLEKYPQDAEFRIEGIFNGDEYLFNYDYNDEDNLLILLDANSNAGNCRSCRL